MNRIVFTFRILVPLTIVSIISLAPAPGFVTLTVPDDAPGSQSFNIPDFSHLSKLPSDPLQLDAIVNLCKLALALALGFCTLFVVRKFSALRGGYFLGIRGPPPFLALY